MFDDLHLIELNNELQNIYSKISVSRIALHFCKRLQNIKFNAIELLFLKYSNFRVNGFNFFLVKCRIRITINCDFFEPHYRTFTDLA